MSARADRIRKSIDVTLAAQKECEAEAGMLRKIVADLIRKAEKLEDMAKYHDRTLADAQARLRDEEATL
jgi:hypothetical protein